MDNQFPFIHQNIATIRLGMSYSVNTGVDVFETMTKTHGAGKFHVVRVHLVDHIPAHPLHQIGNGGQRQGHDRQNEHQLAFRLQIKPGAGNLLTEAINKYDNGVIVGVTLFYAVLSVISIILGDVLMATADPRISFTSKGR